ncbi:hypothetical protein MMC24_005870, partial [Lignoscripta atroalba]|nr:hypothetical protein [Lignoscripta atroalba]
MLSRGYSAQVRRAKSSSSVKPNDSAVSHQHALAAANHAFELANDRANAPKDTAEVESRSRRPAEVNNVDDEGLRRRHSVRFTGPTAVPSQQRPITRREAPILEYYRAGPEGNRPLLKHKDSSTSRPESIITALPPFSANGGQTISTTTSSYRKLRKARSMFNTRKAPSLRFVNSTPKSVDVTPQRYRRLSNSEHRQSQKGTFSRSSTSLPSAAPDYMILTFHPNPQQDAAIQMARDQYLRQLEQQRLTERSSFLDLGRRGRTQKAFRRTVRTSSTNSYGSAIASPNPQVPVSDKSIGHRTRNLSVSLKNRLKRVFHRAPSPVNEMPIQHLRASRAHFRDYISPTTGVDQEQHDVPLPDEELLHRVESRGSSSHRLPLQLDREVRPGSIRTVSSSDNISAGKSRVTSWTNSTAANTMTTRQLKENYLLEKKRLSIIQENGGPYQPSPSTARSDNGYAIFRKPLRNSSGG